MKKLLDKLLIVCFVLYFIFLLWTILFKYVSIVELFSLDRLVERSLEFTSYSNNLSLEVVTGLIFFIPIGIFLCIYSNNAKILPKIVTILFFGFLIAILKFIFILGPINIINGICLVIGGLIGIGIYVLLEKVFKDDEKVKGFMLLFMIIVLAFILLNMFILRFI